jgi:predicted nucleic acid-binding protein
VSDPIVIDASVGIARVRPEIASPPVRLAFQEWAARGVRLVVPSLFWIEVLNSLGKRHRMTLPEIAEAFHELDEVALETVEVDRPLLLAASALIVAHDLTAYDACYLALAETLDAPLATLDRKLAAAAGERGDLIEETRGPRRRSESVAPDGSEASIGSSTPKPASGDAHAGRWPGFGAYIAELRARERAPALVADTPPGPG